MLYLADVLRRFQEREAANQLARERLAVAFGEFNSPLHVDDVHAFTAPQVSHE